MNKIMIFTNEVNDGVEDDVYIKYDNGNDKNFDGNFFMVTFLMMMMMMMIRILMMTYTFACRGGSLGRKAKG